MPLDLQPERHTLRAMKIFTPGMRYMLLGTFLFSIGSLLIKMAGTRLPTMEILYVRGVVGVVLCWFFLRRAGIGMFGHRKLTLTLRGLLGFAALFGEFYVIIHMPLADALVLLFAHPVAVAFFAWLLMGERLSMMGVAAIFLSLTGVVLVCRPEFLFGGVSDLDPVAVWVAMLAILLITAAVLTVRSLAKTEHPAVVMSYPPMVIVLLGLFFSHDWVMPTMGEWPMLLGVALFMNAGQFYMTKGYAIESAARISGVSCLEIVFGAIWGAALLGEIPDAWTFGGGALIILGVLALGWRNAKDSPEPVVESG